jgi:hypothetical protein
MHHSCLATLPVHWLKFYKHDRECRMFTQAQKELLKGLSVRFDSVKLLVSGEMHPDVFCSQGLIQLGDKSLVVEPYGCANDVADYLLIRLQQSGELTGWIFLILNNDGNFYQSIGFNYQLSEEDFELLKSFVERRSPSIRVQFPALIEAMNLNFPLEAVQNYFISELKRLGGRLTYDSVYAGMQGVKLAGQFEALQQISYEKKQLEVSYKHTERELEFVELESEKLMQEIKLLKQENQQLDRQLKKQKRQSRMSVRQSITDWKALAESFKKSISDYEQQQVDQVEMLEKIKDEKGQSEQQYAESVVKIRTLEHENQLLKEHVELLTCQVGSLESELGRLLEVEEAHEVSQQQIQALQDELDVQMSAMSLDVRPTSPVHGLSLGDELEGVGLDSGAEKIKIEGLNQLVTLAQQLGDFFQYVVDHYWQPRYASEVEQYATSAIKEIKEQVESRSFWQRLTNAPIDAQIHDNEQSRVLMERDAEISNFGKSIQSALAEVLPKLIDLVSLFNKNKTVEQAHYNALYDQVVELFFTLHEALSDLFGSELKSFLSAAERIKQHYLEVGTDIFAAQNEQFYTRVMAGQSNWQGVTKSGFFEHLVFDADMLQKAGVVLNSFSELDGYHGVLEALFGMIDQNERLRQQKRQFNAIYFVSTVLSHGSFEADFHGAVEDVIHCLKEQYAEQHSEAVTVYVALPEGGANSLDGLGRDRELMRKGTRVAKKENVIRAEVEAMHQYQMLIFAWFEKLSSCEHEVPSDQILLQAAAAIRDFMQVYKQYVIAEYDRKIVVDLSVTERVVDRMTEGKGVEADVNQRALVQATFDQACDAVLRQDQKFKAQVDQHAAAVIDSLQPSISTFSQYGVPLFPALNKVLAAQREDLQKSLLPASPD